MLSNFKEAEMNNILVDAKADAMEIKLLSLYSGISK